MTSPVDLVAFQTAQALAAATMTLFLESLASLGAELAAPVAEPEGASDVEMSDSESQDAATNSSEADSLFGPLITRDPDLELHIRYLLHDAFNDALRSDPRYETIDTDRLFAFLNDHLSGLIRQSFHPLLLLS